MPLARSRRVLAYAALLLALVALSALDPAGLRKALRNEGEASRLERENAEAEAKVARLRREVRALQGDPAALERAAREELGYVKPGEIVIELPREGRP